MHSTNCKLNADEIGALGTRIVRERGWRRRCEIYMGYKCLYGPWFSFYLVRCSPFQGAVRLWRAKISIFSYKSGYFELFITHYLRIIHQKRNQANELFVRFLKMLKFSRWKHFYKGDLSKWTILTNIGTVSSIFKFQAFAFCQKTSFKIVTISISTRTFWVNGISLRIFEISAWVLGKFKIEVRLLLFLKCRFCHKLKTLTPREN